MIRHTLSVLVSFAVGLAGSAVIASPANALVELYKHEYYGEPHRWEKDNYDYDGDSFTDGTAINDEVTSINNAVPYWTCFFIDEHYQGDYIGLPGYNDQVHMGSQFNDQISSHNMNC